MANCSLVIILPIVLVIILVLLVAVILLAHRLRISHFRYSQQARKIFRLETPWPMLSGLDTQAPSTDMLSWVEQTSDSDIKLAYGEFHACLIDYTERWMKAPILPSDELEAHINAILFKIPEDGLSIDKDRDRDPRVFPNPHAYSSAEICMLLQNDSYRAAIASYIIASVLLRSVSLEEGSPLKTLLPLNEEAIRTFSDIKKSVRTFKITEMMAARFEQAWSDCGEMELYVNQRREFYIDLFEALLQPCVKIERTMLRTQLDYLIDLAVVFGKTVARHPYNTVEYRWGTRNPSGLPMAVPNLMGIDWEGKVKIVWSAITMPGGTESVI